MDSGKALHQYLRGKLRFIGVVALVLVASLIALVIYRESQLLSIEQETAPALNQAQQSLVLQLQVNRLLNELAQSVSIEELADRQRAYSEKLIVLTTQQVFSPLLTKKLQKENNEFTSEIARLALEAEKAEQLKRSSIIQLRLLVDELSGLLAGKRIEKNELFLQITQDNVNDKVTASRAKAFAVISQQLALYEDTYHKIVKTV